MLFLEHRNRLLQSVNSPVKIRLESKSFAMESEVPHLVSDNKTGNNIKQACDIMAYLLTTHNQRTIQGTEVVLVCTVERSVMAVF